MFTTVPLRRGFNTVRNLFELIDGHGVICGGFARFCASPVLDPIPAGDVDVYCHTEEAFTHLRREIRRSLKVKIETPRAVTFHRSTVGLLAYTPEIQLVKPMKKFNIMTVGSTEEILSNFDFTVARAAIVSPEEALVDEAFLTDEDDKALKLKNIHCPISSTLRCVKYANRGYRLRPFDILPLFLDWDARTPEYRQELIDGLTELQAAMEAQEKLSDERLTAIYDMMSVD